MMERQFRILWGPTFETILDFSYPVVGDAPLLWRGLRAGSERVDGATTADVSLTGRDYFLSVTAKWFDLTRAAGATGLQAFIDWANAGNSFTLVPDPINLPTLKVAGCFLEEPFLAPSWSVETGGEMTVNLVIRHPTIDLGLAWRGLFFEYIPGTSLTDPIVATYSRASPACEINNQGGLTQNPSGTLCDGHYPAPLSNGLQTTLLQAAATNKLTAPEDLSNAAWGKGGTTIPSTNNTSPRNDATACFLREDVSNSVHQATQNITLAAAGNSVGGCVFFKANGRTQASFLVVDGANFFQARVDLTTGVVVTFTGGTGVVIFSAATALAGGWYMLQLYGTAGSASTTKTIILRIENAGAESYVGDGASGVFAWGCVATDNQIAGMYWGTGASRVTDSFTFPFSYKPQAMWFYLKFFDIGTNFVPGFSPIAGLANYGNPRLLFDNRAGGQWNIQHLEGGSEVDSTISTIAAVGHTQELLGILFSDGSVQLLGSVDGGADVVGARSAALALSSAWSAQVINLGFTSSCALALISAKAGPGTAVNTMALARII